MKLYIYSIYDEKVEAYNTPFFEKAHPAAIRMFEDLANDAHTSVHRHAQDFTLYAIGEWDDEKADIQRYENPQNLGRASDYYSQTTVSPVELVKKEA